MTACLSMRFSVTDAKKHQRTASGCAESETYIGTIILVWVIHLHGGGIIISKAAASQTASCKLTSHRDAGKMCLER